MEVIYVLIPGMLFLGLVMVGVLVWAVKNGQYDDLEGDANRLLMDDDDQPQNRPQPTNKEIPGGDPRNWPDAD